MTVIFILLAGLAIGCAVSCVYQKNALYSAISLVGTFIALASIYLTLMAPFIAIAQILVYAGAIMVLVIFVILLLNLDEEYKLSRMRYLYYIGALLGIGLLVQTFFIFNTVKKSSATAVRNTTAGNAESIGMAMYTEYLLPVEIVGILLLMGIVGAMIMARRLREPKDLRVEEKE